jgi:hypothetical protein
MYIVQMYMATVNWRNVELPDFAVALPRVDHEAIDAGGDRGHPAGWFSTRGPTETTPPEEPATKRVNPGAKITGVLKSAGDQLSSAVDDLGKQLTKRPSKKAPAAEDEKAAAASE